MIKKIVLKGIKLGLKRAGYVLTRPFPEPGGQKNELLSVFYNNLLYLGYKPQHIVDIGANHGSWTKEALKYFPDAYYTLLEPQYWLADSISDLLARNPKIKFHAVGAGAAKGMFNFTLADRDDSSNFRYTEAEADAAGLERLSLPVISLNELLDGKDLPVPDIIKIDAEGLDIDVLTGASNFFGQTEIFMVEVSIGNKVFENTLLKVICFMDNHGYRVFDITDINRPFVPRILWLAELVFIKKNGFIDAKSYDTGDQNFFTTV